MTNPPPPEKGPSTELKGPDLPDPNTNPKVIPPGPREPTPSKGQPDDSDGLRYGGTPYDTHRNQITTPHADQPWNSLKHILIIVVAIVGVLILSGFIVFLFVYTCRRQRKKKAEPCYGLAANSSHITGVDLPLVVMSHNRQAYPATMNGKPFNDSSIYTSLPSEDEEEQSERAGAAGSDVTYATTGPPPPPPMAGATACKQGYPFGPERYVLPFSELESLASANETPRGERWITP